MTGSTAGKDAFARQSKNAIFGHEYTLKDVFWDRYRIYLKEAVTDRVAGAQALQMALKYQVNSEGIITKRPKLLFARKKTGKKDANGYMTYHRICEPTIEEIISLESNPKRVEDIKQEGVADHAFDKTKYYLLGSRQVPELPPEVKKVNCTPDYGIESEKQWEKEIEEADFEDITGYASGSITDFIK